MTPNTLTLDEVRDELARRDGWTRICGVPGMLKEDGDLHLKWKLRHHEQWDHPHPATLDGAAAALPEGWNIGIQILPNMPCEIAGFKTDHDPVYVCDPDELTARYRLALACRIAEEGK